MSYENNSRKTVVVLNTEFSAPMLMNAMAHAVLGLMGREGAAAWNLLEYPSSAFGTDSRISEYPVVVLRAKKSAPLEKLAGQLGAANILHNVFIDAMIGRTAEEQRSATCDAGPGRNRVMCVALFGEEETIRPLIKSYSVYKASDAQQSAPMDA